LPPPPCAGADPREIVFTSGATESNNLAIKGVARFYAAAGKKHVVTTQTEHKCVLDACRTLEAGGGFDVTYLPVGTDGLVAPAAVAAALRPDTALVSVMGVNNEIGVVQPLAEIGALCRAAGVFFHTDAAQVRARGGGGGGAAGARRRRRPTRPPSPPPPARRRRRADGGQGAAERRRGQD
jgi:cysteine sulfinate desulfinase/cysteine desulfurase-like protein